MTTIRLAIQATSELPTVAAQLDRLIQLTEQSKVAAVQAAQQAAYARADEVKAIQSVEKAILGQAEVTRKAADGQRASLSQLKTDFDELGRKVTSVMGLFGIAFGAAEIRQFVAGMVEAKGKVDIFQGGLTQMLGSKREADALMAQLTKLAITSPFEVKDLMDITVQLKAMGIATAELLPTINMLGNLSAVVGTEKLPLIAKAYTDVSNKQKLMAAETRQFTDNGIPLFDLLATSMGRTRDQVVRMAEDHTISFAQVKKALFEASSEGGRYYRMMEIQAESMSGQVSNLADKFFFAKARLGDYFENGLLKVIKGSSGLIEALAGSESAIDRTVKWVRTAVIAWTGYEVIVNRARLAEVAANVTRAASVAIGGTYNLMLISMAGTTEGFTTAQIRSAVAARSLWGVVAANPIGALLTVVTAVTVAMSAWDAVNTQVTDSVGEQETKLRAELGLITQQVEMTKQAKEGTVERAMAIQFLVNKYPEYFAGLNGEKTSNGDLNKILLQVNRSYQDRIALARETYRVEANQDRLREMHKVEQELMQLAAQRLPKEIIVEIGGDPTKLKAVLDKSPELFAKFNGATDESFFKFNQHVNTAKDTWNYGWKGPTGALDTVIKNIAEVEQQTNESMKRQAVARQQETKSMLDAEMTRHENALKAAKGSNVELKAEQKRHQDNLLQLQGAGQEAGAALAKAGANTLKEIQVFSVADREAFMKGHFARSYQEQIKALDAQERAELDAANKVLVSKKAGLGAEKQFVEAKQAEMIAIHQKYEDKRASLRSEQIGVLMRVVEQEQGIEREALEAIEALQVTTSKDQKERNKQQLKEEKATNAERKKDIRELQQDIQQAERETAQFKKEALKEEVQGRKEAFGMIMDLVGQQGGLIGSVAGLAKKAFSDWDLLAGKSVASAQASLAQSKGVYESSLTSLFEIYKTGDALQIKSQESVVANAKNAVAEGEANVSKISAASLTSTLSLVSMGYQVITQLVDAWNEAEKAKYQATAEAAARTRQVLSDFANYSRALYQDMYQVQREAAKGNFERQIELLEAYYDREKELVTSQSRVDDALAFTQKLAEIRASDMADADKAMLSVWEVQRYREQKGLRETIAGLEVQKEKVKELHELRLQQIEETYQAQKDALDKEIDLAKDAFEQKKTLIEAERDKKKEAIEAQLDTLKTAYDQQKSLAQQQYDDEVTRLNARYDAEKQALRDTYDYRRSLVEQSKADELEAAGIVDRIRDDVLERYRKTEVDKLVAQRERILATITDEAERARVTNEFANRIAQVHKDVEDGKVDKSKATTLITKQLKAEETAETTRLKEEETNKIIELETRQKSEITDLKTQLKTTLDTYRTDYETREVELKGRLKDLETETKIRIEGLQTELKNTILGYQNQIKANEQEAAWARIKANLDYGNQVHSVNAQLFEANKQMAITELRIAVAKLRAAGGSSGLIDELNNLIREIGGQRFDYKDANGANYGAAAPSIKFDTVYREDDPQNTVYKGQSVDINKLTGADGLVGSAKSDGSSDTMFYYERGNDMKGSDFVKVKLAYDANAGELRWLQMVDNKSGQSYRGWAQWVGVYDYATGKRYAKGTEYVEDSARPNGIDTVPAMLTKGERVLTVEQNRQIGLLSNEALVARLRQPGIVVPELSTRLRIPEGMGMGLGNTEVVRGLTEVRQAITDLRQGFASVQQAIEDKQLLQLNIDNGGIAAAMIAHQSKTTYHANAFQF